MHLLVVVLRYPANFYESLHCYFVTLCDPTCTMVMVPLWECLATLVHIPLPKNGGIPSHWGHCEVLIALAFKISIDGALALLFGHFVSKAFFEDHV